MRKSSRVSGEVHCALILIYFYAQITSCRNCCIILYEIFQGCGNHTPLLGKRKPVA